MKLDTKTKVLLLILAVLIVGYAVVTMAPSPEDTSPDNTSESNLELSISLSDQDLFITPVGDVSEQYNLTVTTTYADNTTENFNININPSTTLKIIDVGRDNLRGVSVADPDGNIIATKKFNGSNSQIQLRQISNKNVVIGEEFEISDPVISSESEITNVIWRMGDNTTYTNKSISHTYDSAGSYNVQVIARDSNNNTQAEEFGVFVRPESLITTVQVPRTVQAGEPVQFDGRNSTTDTVERVEWYTQGKIYTEMNPTHTYNNSGAYNIVLTAQSNNNRIESKSIRIVVRDS